MKRTICIFITLLGLLAAHAPAQPLRGSLIRVHEPAAGSAPRLLQMGVPVVRDAGWYLLAVAGDSQLQHLDRMGLSYRILDASIEGKTYYTLTRVGHDRVEDLAGAARVLYSVNGTAVVEGPDRTGDRLAQLGFDVQRVFMRPVVVGRRGHIPAVPVFSAQIDTWIQGMVAEVSRPVIDGYVQRLQDFVTRWALHDSCQAAAEWIKSEFQSFGMDSVFLQNISPMFKDNVVAVLPGKTLPDEIIVIGGHYDSISNNAYIAPGADDNASGTACVLQCARIMSHYEFERTVVFVAFGAEEQGLRGSEYFASQAAAAGDNVVAMVNVDMLGYRALDDDVDIDMVSNSSSNWLLNRAMDVASRYVPGTPTVSGSLPGATYSDHMSFWDHGYDAIMLWEDADQPSPYIHTFADTIGRSYNYPYLAQQSTKVVVALLAELAGPVVTVAAEQEVPAPSISLEQNVPNPFNPRTMIRFTVPPPGASASLRIYDTAGREVRVLFDRDSVVGTFALWWNGTGVGGRPAPSGVYFYRLTAGRQTLSRKLVLIR